MTNPTQPDSSWPKSFFDSVAWGDYERPDGSWGYGVANQEELTALLNQHEAQAVELARIEEQQSLIDAVDENHSDKYPEIVETDPLTYVSHGYAVACRQMKHNAKHRIDALRAGKERDANT